MDGPEFLIAAISIISMFVILPSIIVNGIVRAKKAKSTAKGGDQLRMSELQLLIETAVEDATAPLHARIARLEEAHRQLEPARPFLALDEGEEAVSGRAAVRQGA